MLEILKLALGPVIEKALDLIPNLNERARAKEAMEAGLLSAAAEAMKSQTEINKIEAAHQSIFVAGWRPAIGWVGAIGLFWSYVGQPVAIWTVTTFGLGIAIPLIPTENLLELVLAMLGIGGMRSWEKSRGLTSGVKMPWQ